MSKKRITYGLLFVIACGALIWSVVTKGDNVPEYESATVERGMVLHTVSVTGHVEPVKRINLAFPVGGRISALPVEEGARIVKDTVAAVLDGGIDQATLREAQARVKVEQAKLNDVSAPLRKEERAVKEVAVENAETALQRAEESAWKTIARAFVYADDAVHEEADELFENTKGDNPSFGVTFSYGTTKYIIQADATTESELTTQRHTIERLLSEMRQREGDKRVAVGQALADTDDDLVFIETFLNRIATVINKYVSDDTNNQAVYETFQTSIASARNAVATARSDIATAYTNYSGAQSTLELAKSDLALAEAGASRDTVAAQEAALASAMAAVGTAEEKSQDNVLLTPFAGILSQIYYKVGEIVGPYEPVAELLSDDELEIEAYIPEADIARVELGDTAEITFDAFDNDELFQAEVIRIALSETYREGVPTYKTTLRLENSDQKELTIRPGMTADVEIHTDIREDTLFVPVRSVVRENGRTFVRVFEDNGFTEKNITTGLRGSEGTVAVVSGLVEGEEIVLYIEES